MINQLKNAIKRNCVKHSLDIKIKEVEESLLRIELEYHDMKLIKKKFDAGIFDWEMRNDSPKSIASQLALIKKSLIKRRKVYHKLTAARYRFSCKCKPHKCSPPVNVYLCDISDMLLVRNRLEQALSKIFYCALDRNRKECATLFESRKNMISAFKSLERLEKSIFYAIGSKGYDRPYKTKVSFLRKSNNTSCPPAGLFKDNICRKYGTEEEMLSELRGDLRSIMIAMKTLRCRLEKARATLNPCRKNMRTAFKHFEKLEGKLLFATSPL